jgi:hypothetical protein
MRSTGRALSWKSHHFAGTPFFCRAMDQLSQNNSFYATLTLSTVNLTLLSALETDFKLQVPTLIKPSFYSF